MRLAVSRCRIWVLGALLTFAAAATVTAQQVDYGSVGNRIREPDLSPAEPGDLVRLGTFAEGFDFAAHASNFEGTNSAFTEFDRTTIGAADGSGPGQFYDSGLVPPAFKDRQLYIWIADAPTAGSASAWVIITATNWRVPAEGDVLIADSSESAAVVARGALGTTTANSNSPNQVDFVMQPASSPSPTPTSSPSPSVSPPAAASPSPTAAPSTPTLSPTANPSPTPATSAAPVRASNLANLATRLHVGTGENVLIAGFIVRGNGEKRLIIRGTGPSLQLAGRLADPVLELHDSAGKIAENDDWQENDNREEIRASGVPPTDPQEPALLRRLLAGGTALYTAVVRGKNEATGIGLVEVYDLDQGAAAQLVNTATRGYVQTGDDVMIGGLIVTADDAEAETEVVIRAIGPSLAIDDKLSDPQLTLLNEHGDLIVANDDWKDGQRATIEASRLEPLRDQESAIRITLKPGIYTAVLSGKNEGTGVALIEVYKLSD